MFKKLLAISLTVPIMLYAITDEFDMDFHAGVATGQTKLQELATSQQKINPETLFRQKVQEAPEAQYYQDGDKIPESLTQKGSNVISHDETLQVIQENESPRNQELPDIKTLTTQVSILQRSDLKGQDVSDEMGHAYQSNGDFHQAISGLSGQVDAAKSMRGGLIFTGTAMKCREIGGSFNNCCTDSGWGQDLHLSHCNQEEKTLGKSREKKLVVEIGEYCAHHYPWPHRGCREYKQAFCVFDSKLARIIQERGRGWQLGMDFGSAENPNCSGITSLTLQRINFSTIDFSEYYQSIHERMSVHDAESIRKSLLTNFNNGKYDHG